MGTFQKSQMLYDDGEYYKWTAKAANDNPFFIQGVDYSELNRTEGYEVLYFINLFCDEYFEDPLNIETYQKVEELIRFNVPSFIKTHDGVTKWLLENWNNLTNNG